jgi:predicted HTH domain antitoxin
MQVMMDVPEKYLLDETADELIRKVKLYAAVVMFSVGEISAGSACEFAGVDRMTFTEECARLSIPTINYSPEDLKAEYEQLLESTDARRR